MKFIKSIFFILLLSLLFTTSCIPPRCKVPQCAIIIDHVHGKHGKGGVAKGKKGQLVLYRGVPWYRYIFRKKYRVNNEIRENAVKGKYRKIDTREAYDK